MIRRHVGDEFWLISQDDHAQLSGQLARLLGNSRFSPPSSSAAILGIALHDCGWPIHDEQPLLNAAGLPADVFETPRHVALAVWEASADRAAGREDYAGLLVSLHVLALSVFAIAQSPIPSSRWDMNDARTRFEVNRFQHRQIELQESLRTRLGLRTDRPLHHGLAEDSPDPREQRLVFDFRWLQAMDRLSLSICCTNPPFAAMEPVLPRAGAPATSIRISRHGNDRLDLDPWPFAEPQARLEVPMRRLPAETFDSEQRFRDACAAAPIERFAVGLRPTTGRT